MGGKDFKNTQHLIPNKLERIFEVIQLESENSSYL